MRKEDDQATDAVTAGQERFRTRAQSDGTEIHDIIMRHEDVLRSMRSWLSVIDMCYASKVNTFLVNAHGSWQRRWSRGTRGSRADQSLGEGHQEHNVMLQTPRVAWHVCQWTKWWSRPVGNWTDCQILWCKKVITADAQHGLQNDVNVASVSQVPADTAGENDDDVADAGSAQDHATSNVAG